MFRLAWLALLALYLWAWIRALVEIVRTPDHGFRAGSQVLWAVVVLLAPFIGLVLYYAVGSPERR